MTKIPKLPEEIVSKIRHIFAPLSDQHLWSIYDYTTWECIDTIVLRPDNHDALAIAIDGLKMQLKKHKRPLALYDKSGNVVSSDSLLRARQ